MLHVLLETFLPRFDQYLKIYTFLTLQYEFQPKKELGSGINGSAIFPSA
jgi:hypothetical protein